MLTRHRIGQQLVGFMRKGETLVGDVLSFHVQQKRGYNIRKDEGNKKASLCATQSKRDAGGSEDLINRGTVVGDEPITAFNTMMKKTLCLFLILTLSLTVTPVFASEEPSGENVIDYTTGTPWLCSDLDGNVTADTPTPELSEDFYLACNMLNDGL